MQPGGSSPEAAQPDPANGGFGSHSAGAFSCVALARPILNRLPCWLLKAGQSRSGKEGRSISYCRRPPRSNAMISAARRATDLSSRCTRRSIRSARRTTTSLFSAISPGVLAARTLLQRGATRRYGCGTSTTRSASGRRAISSPSSTPSGKRLGRNPGAGRRIRAVFRVPRRPR